MLPTISDHEAGAARFLHPSVPPRAIRKPNCGSSRRAGADWLADLAAARRHPSYGDVAMLEIGMASFPAELLLLDEPTCA